MSGIKEIKIRKDDEYIKLGQLLKKAGVVTIGADAKFMIEDGLVSVNGETEYKRGKKLIEGDSVSGEDWAFKIVK